MATGERTGTVPVVTFDYTTTEAEGTWFARYDELRQQFPWYRNEFGPGFWTVCNYEGILEIMQNPQAFSNSVVTALEPNPPVKWIPEMLDGDEHKQWRRQLGSLFSPARWSASNRRCGNGRSTSSTDSSAAGPATSWPTSQRAFRPRFSSK